MKKNKMMRLASFLLIAVLVSTSAISGTYAKYTTSGFAEDQARVAKWGVTVAADVTTDTFGTDYVAVDGSISASYNASTDSVHSAGGKVVAANMWGKCKTVSQMAGIILSLAVYGANEIVTLPSNVFVIADIVIVTLFWISAILCVISGVIYIWGGREYIKNAK